MLVLSRQENETIVIDGEIIVTIVEIRGNQIRLGIEAPKRSCRLAGRTRCLRRKGIGPGLKPLIRFADGTNYLLLLAWEYGLCSILPPEYFIPASQCPSRPRRDLPHHSLAALIVVDILALLVAQNAAPETISPPMMVRTEGISPNNRAAKTIPYTDSRLAIMLAVVL